MAITRLGTYSQIKGTSFKLPCRVATTANITLSGTQTIDGVAVVAGERVLVKNQSASADNGVYIVAAGAWSRAVDFSLDDDVFQGLEVYVSSGTANGGYTFVVTTANPITLGTTGLTFGGTYLPLSGGTLTGALSGTSATFSGIVNIGTTGYLAPLNILTKVVSSVWTAVRLYDGIGGNYWWDIGSINNTSAADLIFSPNGGSPTLSIKSTGAATFSSSVTANATSGGGAIYINSNASNFGDLYYFSNDGATLYSYIRGNSTEMQFRAQGSRELQFYTNNTNRLTITSGGNVGIGISPSYRLDVSSGASGVVLNLEGTNAYNAETGILMSSGRAKISGFLNGSGGTPGTSLRFYTMPDGGSVTEAMRITSGGVVQIGQSVSNDAATRYLQIQGSGTTAAAVELINYWNGTAYTAGVYGGKGSNAAATLLFKVGYYNGTAAAQRDAMFIDESGNVGIGTTSPQERFEISGLNGNIRLYGRSGISQNQLSSNVYYNGSSWTRDNASYGAVAIQLDGTGGNLIFNTTSATSGFPDERMRITSGGYLKASNDGTYVNSTGTYHEFRQTANSDGLSISSTNTSYTGAVQVLRANRNTTNATWYYLQCYNDASSASKLFIADSGNVTNTNGSYGTISDIKLKENIIDATPKLQNILKLKVRNFNLIGNETKQIGFIAQEFEEIFPSMIEKHIDRDADGNDLGTVTKSIKSSVLVPMLVKSIQEMSAQIEELKAKLN